MEKRISYGGLKDILSPRELKNVLGGCNGDDGGVKRECIIVCKDGSDREMTLPGNSCDDFDAPCGDGINWNCGCYNVE